MKYFVAIVALAIAAPAAAQTDPHAGHQPGQREQHKSDDHDQHKSKGKMDCCGDKNGNGKMDCCEGKDGDKKADCCAGKNAEGDHAGHDMKH